MKQYDTILFDFDGTIMNTMEGITRGVEYALLQMNITPPPREQLTCFIGPPILEGFARFYQLDEQAAQTAATIYREYYAVHGLLECEPYPGAEQLLAALKKSGRTVALATSKPQPFAEAILNATGLMQYFDVLSGAGLDGSHNTKEQVIRAALAQLPGHALARCLMVGDRDYDVVGAQAVGIPCVGVLHGFGSRAEFEAAGADYMVEDMAALERLLLG